MSRTEQRAGFGNRYLVIDSFISTRDKRLELLRDRMTDHLNHQMSAIRRCIARNSGLRFVGNVQHCQHLVEESRVTLISKKSPSKYYQQLGGVNTGLTESRKSQVGEGKKIRFMSLTTST
jgi:hypothetical protein